MSRHRSPRNNKFRNITGFFLYIFIALFSLSCCGILCVANARNVADVFTNYSYVESLKKDISQYAVDRCQEASIPDDFVAKTISYGTVHQLEESYIYSTLKVSDQYNDNAFDALMTDFEEKLTRNVQDMVDKQGINVDSKDGVKSFCTDISTYVRNKIEFRYQQQFKSAVKKVRVLSYVALVFSAIMLIVLGTFLFKKGGKQYRIFRNLSYSFLAAFILDYIVLFAGLMVKLIKDLVIYPTYLAKAFMTYYDGVLLSVTYAGAILLLASVAMAALTWQLKRQERE